MAPRPAFLSSLGGGRSNVPTGLKSPTQMDRDRERSQLPDTSRPAFLSDLGGGVPTGLVPPSQRDTSPFVSRAPSVDEIFQNLNINEDILSDTGTGSVATGFANPGGMPGKNKSQQFLGDNYERFIALGYTPSEIDAQLEKALSFGSGINVDKIEDQLNKFEQFQASDFAQGLSNTLPVIDGENVFSVNKPIITANPRGGIGIFGELFGGLADAAGDLGSAIIEGDAGTLNVLKNLGNKIKGSLPSFGELVNPGDIAGRLAAAGPEAQRKYAMLLQQRVPYQQAFEEATGQKFALGGITTLQ